MQQPERQRVMVLCALASSALAVFWTGEALSPSYGTAPLAAVLMKIVAMAVIVVVAAFDIVRLGATASVHLVVLIIGIALSGLVLSPILNLSLDAGWAVSAGIVSVGFWIGWIVLRSRDGGRSS